MWLICTSLVSLLLFSLFHINHFIIYNDINVTYHELKLAVSRTKYMTYGACEKIDFEQSANQMSLIRILLLFLSVRRTHKLCIVDAKSEDSRLTRAFTFRTNHTV